MKEKTHLSFAEQIKKFENNGLSFNNTTSAQEYLALVSYYRLNSYRFPFINKDTKQFLNSTEFQNITTLYNVDTLYKMHLFALMQVIEVAFKTQLIYHFSKDDPYFYHKIKHYKNYQKEKQFKKLITFIGKIKKSYKNINNVHILYYAEKHNCSCDSICKKCQNYKNSKCSKNFTNCTCYPQAWVALETLDFGTLIDIYAKTNDSFTTAKQEVTNFFNIKAIKVLITFLSEVKRIRNIVAHHDKIIDRYKFIKSESIGILESIYNIKIAKQDMSTFLPYFLMIKHFMETILAKSEYAQAEKYIYTNFLEISKKNKDLLSLTSLNDSFYINNNR